MSSSALSSLNRSTTVLAFALTALTAAGPIPAHAQAGGTSGGSDSLLTIEAHTDGFDLLDGFLPLYWDPELGRLWMEIPALGRELIHTMGFGAGLGSNDIGIDRGALAGSALVRFERVGRKILMVEPNYRFRADTENPEERRAVEDAFARSVLWGFTAAAETDGRVLVDLTDWLIRDAADAGQRLSPGTYRLDPSRSSVYMGMTDVFPTNTEIEVELTFVQQPGAGGGRGGGAFEGVGSVAASGDAASIRLHHSFVQLPDDGFELRPYDPRSGFGTSQYQDYAVPLGTDMTRRSIRRHRLAKIDPTAPVSDPVEPIVYYLDPGTPEPIRSALLEGAGWWNQAFEAAGYRDAFQVRIRPDSISPLDARYNVINWVHRSTRGWSTGGSVTDPRTGEIIKGVVTLGSLRVRQDYLIAEGLLSPYEDGDEAPPELAEWALARVRQLSAHEVGHTLGLGHNYYNSRVGRISVMDYPHPLVRLTDDGSIDFSEVYDAGIGAFDRVAITYGYQDFAEGTNAGVELDRILSDAWDDDIRYLTNQDVSTTPQADQWANGTDVAAELDRMLDVRAAALTRFGERAIQGGRPMATIEEALVPLYLHHRYQVESAVTAVGGVRYTYAMRGDGLRPLTRVLAAEQNAALEALMRTLRPAELALPDPVLNLIPPRPPGWGRDRETFPRYTGGSFDAITPAVVVAAHTVDNLLAPDRAARLVEQEMLDPALPGLDDVIRRVLEAAFDFPVTNAYEREIQRAVQGVVVDAVRRLAEGAPMLAVRATADAALRGAEERLLATTDSPSATLLAADIRRFLDRPTTPANPASTVAAPPGAPIGMPSPLWMDRPAIGFSSSHLPECSWRVGGW